MNTCQYVCDTLKGNRCDLTNRPCNHPRPCELSREDDDELEDEEEDREKDEY